MTPTRYSPAQIALHWLSALLVLIIIALPYGSDLFGPLLGGTGGVFTLHKSLGITVLVLTVLRLLVRARQGAPNLLGAHSALQQRAAKAGHALLYLLLVLMPLTGILFGKRPLDLFWLVEIGPVAVSDSVRELAKLFHVTAQYLLFAMILGHAGMALWHHHVHRDGVLRAMLPGRN
ncbi:cytochrome b561 [Pseudomonas cuatrocienegasensis]|uniref:Cytochrome b561 n=1 Tax=Pseudomonas cuatrocienegasensis TaxID=543360 RepID=A0ABY1B867_9PSED|nr:MULTISPECIES: cytochrome b/b6 domain-containing protein [Pseudomonas]OEC33895.1 cytochrome B [Pseudomonas sp. 21C1]SEQ19741.1 cytochrome b561 [Pseudomonas cuatrocienegasensis]